MIKAKDAGAISRSAVLDPHILDQISFAIIKEASQGNQQLGLVLYFRQLMLTNIMITLKNQDLKLVPFIKVNMGFMQFGNKNKRYG